MTSTVNNDRDNGRAYITATRVLHEDETGQNISIDVLCPMIVAKENVKTRLFSEKRYAVKFENNCSTAEDMKTNCACCASERDASSIISDSVSGEAHGGGKFSDKEYCNNDKESGVKDANAQPNDAGIDNTAVNDGDVKSKATRVKNEDVNNNVIRSNRDHCDEIDDSLIDEIDEDNVNWASDSDENGEFQSDSEDDTYNSSDDEEHSFLEDLVSYDDDNSEHDKENTDIDNDDDEQDGYVVCHVSDDGGDDACADDGDHDDAQDDHYFSDDENETTGSCDSSSSSEDRQNTDEKSKGTEQLNALENSNYIWDSSEYDINSRHDSVSSTENTGDSTDLLSSTSLTDLSSFASSFNSPDSSLLSTDSISRVSNDRGDPNYYNRQQIQDMHLINQGALCNLTENEIENDLRFLSSCGDKTSTPDFKGLHHQQNQIHPSFNESHKQTRDLSSLTHGRDIFNNYNDVSPNSLKSSTRSLPSSPTSYQSELSQENISSSLDVHRRCQSERTSSTTPPPRGTQRFLHGLSPLCHAYGPSRNSTNNAAKDWQSRARRSLFIQEQNVSPMTATANSGDCMPWYNARFKSEDEEAVHYLVTKYLDNADMVW